MRDTLREALIALFGEAPDTLEEGLDPDESIAPIDGAAPELSEVADLLLAAEQAFLAAEEALRDGDLAEYQERIAEARESIRRATEMSTPDRAGGGAEPGAPAEGGTEPAVSLGEEPTDA